MSKVVDFDGIHQEIEVAEKYLDQRKSSSLSSSQNINLNFGGITPRTSIDSQRRADILRQFGRKPLQSKFLSDSTSNLRSSISHESQGDGDLTPDSIEFDRDQPKDHVSDARKKKYSDPKEREQLITRLLAMADKQRLEDKGGISTIPRDSTVEDNQIERLSDSKSNPSSEDSKLFYASDLLAREKHQSQSRKSSLEDLSYSNIDIKPPKISKGSRKASPVLKTILASTHRDRPSSAPPRHKPFDIESSNQKQSSSNIKPTRFYSPSPSLFFQSQENRKYLKSREDLIRESEEKFRQNYVFEPRLYTKDSPLSPTKPVNVSYPPPTKHSSTSKRDRIEEMLREYKKSLKLREQKRREEENFELLECTFTPSITKKAEILAKQRQQQDLNFSSPTSMPSGSGISPSPSPGKISDRLHEDALKRIQQQKWLSKHVEEARLAQYTFQPLINPRNPTILTSSAGRNSRVNQLFRQKSSVSPSRNQHGSQPAEEDDLEYIPIYERVAELQKEKSKRFQDLKASIEEKTFKEMTFHPKIDSKSLQLAQQRLRHTESEISVLSRQGHEVESGMALVKRLEFEGEKILRKKQKLLQQFEDEEYEKYYQSKYTGTTVAGSTIAGPVVTGTFDTRQKEYLEKLKQKRKEIELEQKKYIQENYFHPKIISKSTEILQHQRPERFQETIQDRIDRLSKSDIENHKAVVEELELKVYHDVTFRPEINEISKEIGRVSNLEELVENQRGKIKREMQRKRLEELRTQQFSFRPQITTYYDTRMSVDTELGQGKRSTGSSSGLPSSYQDHIGWMECPVDEIYRDNPQTQVQSQSQPRSDRYQDNRLEGSSSPYLKMNFKEPEKMAKEIRYHLHEKEEKRRLALIEKEIQELEQCSFHPEVAGFEYKKKLRHDPVIVRGLGRYLELKNHSFRMKEEAMQREQEVFRVQNIHSYRRPEDGSTILEPFNLSESNPNRQSRVIQELLQEEKNNLSFTPDTIEHRRKIEFLQKKKLIDSTSYD